MTKNMNKNRNKSNGLSKEGEHLLEIKPPSSTIHVGRFGTNVNRCFWWEPRVASIECSKRADPCRRLYGCIVGMGDKRQDLIPGFVAWIDVSGTPLLESFVEVFNEAICLRMVWGRKHLLDT